MVSVLVLSFIGKCMKLITSFAEFIAYICQFDSSFNLTSKTTLNKIVLRGSPCRNSEVMFRFDVTVWLMLILVSVLV